MPLGTGDKTRSNSTDGLAFNLALLSVQYEAGVVGASYRCEKIPDFSFEFVKCGLGDGVAVTSALNVVEGGPRAFLKFLLRNSVQCL